MSTPSNFRAPRREAPIFKLYIDSIEKAIDVILTQEDNGKRICHHLFGLCLLDPKTKYVHIEKLCLLSYYAYAKLRYNLLSSTCFVAC